MNQAHYLTPIEKHSPPPAPTLTAYWLDQPCSDPPAHSSRRHPEVLDNLRHSNQDIIGACIHVAILSKRENDVKNNLLSHVA